MFQLLLRGVIGGVAERPGIRGEKPTCVVSIKVKVFRQGERVDQEVLVTLDAFLTERFKKLKPDTKYITFRCSDAMPAYETNAAGRTEAILWAKGEEFFL